VLHGPHHRFLDLRFREREFTAVAEAGDDLMELGAHILDPCHARLFSIAQNPVLMPHRVVDRPATGRAINGVRMDGFGISSFLGSNAWIRQAQISEQ